MANLTYRQRIKRTYGGEDPREVPLYSIPRASRYLKIPQRTIRDWVMGWKYQTMQGERLLDPVIKLPKPDVPVLSFMNLVEAHVLGGMRRLENVPFPKVRRGLNFLEERYPSRHPLADRLFETDGVNLFIRDLDQLINISENGQVEMKEVVSEYLRRIDRNINVGVVRLYPFLKKEPSFDEPKRVMIDPLISFGRPVLVGTGVPTDIIAERFYAGDTFDDLAKDYDITPAQVEEAIRYEGDTRKAA
ncbi:MAG TPA: DUF433 domain-containing protein [Pyrinomonadaceae bacterium]|nr:DUF433 domain-containing protein [Pyrinomonadaceae bacterium]